MRPLRTKRSALEEERDVARVREWSKNNLPIPHEEVLAEFGLTMAYFERIGQTPLPLPRQPS